MTVHRVHDFLGRMRAGNRQQVVLKDLQRHPAKESVMHADFLRVNENKPIKLHVPIHFINEAKSYGVKTEGGIVQHQETDIEVQCLPKVVSVAMALGEDHDLAVASIIAPRGSSEEEEDEAAAEAADEDAADAEGEDEGDSED